MIKELYFITQESDIFIFLSIHLHKYAHTHTHMCINVYI